MSYQFNWRGPRLKWLSNVMVCNTVRNTTQAVTNIETEYKITSENCDFCIQFIFYYYLFMYNSSTLTNYKSSKYLLFFYRYQPLTLIAMVMLKWHITLPTWPSRAWTCLVLSVQPAVCMQLNLWIMKHRKSMNSQSMQLIVVIFYVILWPLGSHCGRSWVWTPGESHQWLWTSLPSLWHMEQSQ